MPDLLGVAAWPATPADTDVLVDLYRGLEAEQTALKAMWPLADGLAEPVAEAFAEALQDADSWVLLGGIDGIPFGFLLARSLQLLPQAGGRRLGVIQLIYTDHEAREVGIGEAMLALALSLLRDAGHDLFDARVLPGHRNAKNFFEAAGFSARIISMHHATENGRR